MTRPTDAIIAVAGLGLRALPAIEQWGRTIIRAVNPHPIFHPFTQTFVDGIHQDVFRLFLQLMMVAQPVVKKIPLPFNPKLDGHELFPVGNERLHARLARNGDDGVQMVGHQQAKATMPEMFFMVVRHGGKDRIADASLTKLVFAQWHAFDGDEKRAAFRHPLRDGVRKFFPDRQIHTKTIMKRLGEKKPAGRTGCSLTAGCLGEIYVKRTTMAARTE